MNHILFNPKRLLTWVSVLFILAFTSCKHIPKVSLPGWPKAKKETPAEHATTQSLEQEAEKDSFADRKLKKILSRQENFFRRIQSSPNPSEDETLQLQAQQIVSSYESLISENPNELYPLIFYGKFLRKVREDEHAITVFLRADHLSPKIAVIKQQLSAILAENGKFQESLGYILEAVELEPQTAPYQYQLGELLHTFKDEFVAENMFSRQLLEEKMMVAFNQAVKLDPTKRNYQMRQAKAYFHTESPNRKRLQTLWENLLPGARSDLERNSIQLHIASNLAAMGNKQKALEIAHDIHDPRFKESKQQLLNQLQ